MLSRHHQIKTLQENHYYPFGLRHHAYAPVIRTVRLRQSTEKEIKQIPPEAVVYKYKYNGKELQEELGLNWYDYGARNYDAALDRFNTLDPDAEKYHSQSPYIYANNNPVRLMDIDGKGTEDEWIQFSTGETVKVGDKGGDKTDYITKVNEDGSITKIEQAAGKMQETPNMKKEGSKDSYYSLGGLIEGEIKADPKIWIDEWKESNNVLIKGSYETANSFYIVGQSLNPFDKQITTLTGETLNGTDRSEYGANVVATLLPVGSTKIAAGPTKQWLRIGPSYSKGLSQPISKSIRWGASPARNGKYLKQIPSSTFRRFNQWLRKQKLPGNSWRVKDAGHFHIKK